MRRQLIVVTTLVVLVAVALAGVAISASASQAPKPTIGMRYHASCGTTEKTGWANCFALNVDNLEGGLTPNAAAPSGYGPADLQKAYKLNAAAGAGQTVAIVDAFDDPKAEADLAVYRSHFGLPACTTANGCFKKVNQTGGTTYPASNTGWAEEISLDLDMVSAACPLCHILLVEANDNSFTNLSASVNTAVNLGAKIVSNSYGGPEASSEQTFASFYNHPGVIITVSSGDKAFSAGAQIPAAYNTVVAVGGTSLTKATNSRGFTEKAWSGAGSGCSKFITKPTWQHDTKCTKRTVADVSAVADPNTGVAVYDTFNTAGWMIFGGTSASAPLIAAVYALAGNATTLKSASSLYSHTGNLFDVTSGKNGTCGNYLCTAVKGYDGPTGLGTPNSTAAF